MPLSEQIFSDTQRERWKLVEPLVWSTDAGRVAVDGGPSIAETLLDEPRWLQPHLLYDARGSRLFEKICSLPEYYLTRTEEAILESEGAAIIEMAPVQCIVELGAGFSRKTVHLLGEQLLQRGAGTFVPVDVSLTALLGSRDALRRQFPHISFQGLLAQYEEGVSSIRKELPTLFAFLGSSIGNFDGRQFHEFFRLLASCMGSSDFLVLGIDRVKSTEILERAYNDSQGITAEFILNAFANVNRLAQGNIQLDELRYVSEYNAEASRIEMYGVSNVDQEISLSSAGCEFLWKKGERILVEISRKFEPDQVRERLQEFGLRTVGHFTDPKSWFSLLLFRKQASETGPEV